MIDPPATNRHHLSHLILQVLERSLDRDSTRRFVVAYSGGIDSHVLLHAMHRYLGADNGVLYAAHVDHGLHDDSGQWSRHCVATAMNLGIPITVLKIDERPPAGESVESWARRRRYRLLRTVMGQRDVLLTAHHRDDLAETALLQLFRGAGPHGLASIPERRSFGPGSLVRPLLNATRAEIGDYARAHRLDWLDDPSNAADRYDRNYIRHRVLTAVEQRWPAVATRIAHVVALQQQAAACLDAAADAVLGSAISTDGVRLPLVVPRGVDDEMQRWVLRRWIVRAGFPLPDAVHLREMQRLLRARQDAQPCVSWKRAELRRHRDHLYLRWSRATPDCGIDYPWDMREALVLPTGALMAEVSVGGGLDATLVAEHKVVVRFRRGGEHCHPLDRPHRRSLKRLFQEWGVPTWQRAEIPLVFIDGELAAVADRCIARPFAAGVDKAGWRLRWHADDVQGPTPDD